MSHLQPIESELKERRIFVHPMTEKGLDVIWIGANPARGGFDLCWDVGMKIVTPPNVLYCRGGAGGRISGRFGAHRGGSFDTRRPDVAHGTYRLPEVDLEITFSIEAGRFQTVSIGGAEPCRWYPSQIPSETVVSGRVSGPVRTAPQENGWGEHRFFAQIEGRLDGRQVVVPTGISLRPAVGRDCGLIGTLVIEPMD